MTILKMTAARRASGARTKHNGKKERSVHKVDGLRTTCLGEVLRRNGKTTNYFSDVNIVVREYKDNIVGN